MTAIIARRTLLALVVCLLAAAPAQATHWQAPDSPPWEQEDEWEDPVEDEGWEVPAPAEVPADPPAEPPPVPAPAPQLPWEEDGDGDWEEPEEPEVPLVTTPTVAGRVAMLRTNGRAAIPRGAPKRVRAIIAAANRIVGKPYKWGGGHAKLADRGYDCSGTVSYALIRSGTGLLSAPMVSGSFKRWGVAGAGRWVSVYANKGHVYMEVAGLRLDTSAAADPGGRKGVRWRPVTGRRRGFTARHPAGL